MITNQFRRTHEYAAECTSDVMGEVNAQIAPLIAEGVRVRLDTEQLTFFGAGTHRYRVRVVFRPGAFVQAQRFENWLRDKGWYG